jgi:hypothetical protein
VPDLITWLTARYVKFILMEIAGERESIKGAGPSRRREHGSLLHSNESIPPPLKWFGGVNSCSPRVARAILISISHDIQRYAYSSGEEHPTLIWH